MDDIDTLINAAKDARERAYAPYSQFRVGAALLSASGRIYTGCNIENASYGASVCAERVAIFKAISEGEKSFSTIAVISDDKDYVFPCGICRQVIWEFNCDADIMVCTASGCWQHYSIKELLPHAFG